VLALISMAIVGKEGMAVYPRYVVHLEHTLARGAIVPSDMPNLRGAIELLFRGAPQTRIAVLLISLGVFMITAWECRKNGAQKLFDLKFSLAVIATVLVSYHAMVYDLSVLMVPVFLLANELLGKAEFRVYPRVLITTAVAIFFFVPLQVVLSMRDHRSALLGWVLLLWLSGVAGEISFSTPTRAQTLRNT
jgi:hypothetical protein